MAEQRFHQRRHLQYLLLLYNSRVDNSSGGKPTGDVYSPVAQRTGKTGLIEVVRVTEPENRLWFDGSFLFRVLLCPTLNQLYIRCFSKIFLFPGIKLKTYTTEKSFRVFSGNLLPECAGEELTGSEEVQFPSGITQWIIRSK